jgi:hypothetical protein
LKFENRTYHFKYEVMEAVFSNGVLSS